MAGWGPAGGSQYTIWKRAHQVGDKDSQDGHRNRDGEGRHSLEAIRQALLELAALSASGHERMVNGSAAASGEKRMDLSEEIAWFSNILHFGDILTKRDRSSRSCPARSFPIRMSVDGSSQRGKVCARPQPAGPGGRRENSGQRIWSKWRVAREQWPVVSGQ